MANNSKIRLTQRREKWAASRTEKVIFEGTKLQPNAAVSIKYAKKIDRLVLSMLAETRKEITRMFESEVSRKFFAADESLASQARILTNKLNRKFQNLFDKKSPLIAESMVKQVNESSAKGLHSSLQKLSGGMSLKTSINTGPMAEVTKAAVAENVALIRSISAKYMEQVQGAVMRSITTGNGLQDLIPALQQFEGMTKRRAKNIALDQTRKTYNAVNKARMQKIGVKKFKWIHSGGGAHPREDHVRMDGNIYSFDDLPVIDARTGERGIPGQAVNCRCTMSPVFTLDEDEST
jgi:SPP1 gp7 family putative phage head morphogenesis protein